MVTTLFDQALDAKRLPRPDNIERRGFGAQIFSDYISRDDFQRIVDLALASGPTAIIVHHAELGAEESQSTYHNAAEAWRAVFDLSSEDMIAEFHDKALYVWLPAGERLSVVFGDNVALSELGTPERLSRAFSDYVEGSGLTECGQSLMNDCLRRYIISPAVRKP